MDTGTVVAVVAVIVVLLLVAGGAYVLWTSVLPARRTARLRERFGDEYDQAVRAHGDASAAEQDLSERLRQRSGAELRDLTEEQRERHTGAWAEVQQGFVDDPAGAARRARHLTAAIMADLGYPDRGEGDEAFEQRAKDLSVDHPGAVADFHRAHAAGRLAEADRARTEDLREALVAYRGLVTALLGGTDPVRAKGAAPEEGPGEGRTGRAQAPERAGTTAQDGPAAPTGTRPPRGPEQSEDAGRAQAPEPVTGAERAARPGADQGSPEGGNGPVTGAGPAER